MLKIQGITMLQLKEKKTWIINLSAIFLLPLIFLLIVCYTGNTDAAGALRWMRASREEFLLSYLLSFAIVNLFYVFSKKIYIALFSLLTFVFSLASYVSRIKCDYRGEPLMPFDLKLGKEALNVSQAYFRPDILALCMAVGLAIGGVAAGMILYPRDSRFRVSRIFVPIISIFLLFTITFNKPLRLADMFKIQEITWDQRENYYRNGFLLGLSTNIKWLNVQKPEGYSRQKIIDIEKDIEKDTQKEAEKDTNPSVATAQQRPDIIVIQSEAFWDITRLSNLQFSKDPLPYFHSLQREFTSGDLLVPAMGGATANTEFQVLTGMTERFMPPGAIAYNQYIRDPMETVVTALKQDGYRAAAIHSYWNWFYKRDEVYKHFGFDSFVSAEYFNNPVMKGPYIADQEVADKIIDALRADSAPKFLFAVTMQNHGPYTVTGDYNADVKVKGDLGEESQEMIERYADNLSDADKALRSLISEIKREDRPAVVIFYGDHLPYLGADNLAYAEAGYLSGLTAAEQYLKMYSTPYVIWDNIGLKKGSLDMGANFMLPYVLEKLGLKGNIIADCINGLHRKGIEAIPKNAYDDELGVDESALKDLEQLQYDMLFGNGYVYNGNVPQAPENYTLGLGEIMVDSVSVGKSGGKSVLYVKGKNLTQTCQVNVNGENVKTTFIDESNLTCELPEAFVEDAGVDAGADLTVSVNVIDTLNRVIAVSNSFQADIQAIAQ